MRTAVLSLVLILLPQDESLIDIRVTEGQKAIPFRIHLRDPKGKPVQGPGHPFWRDHFVADGRVRLSLPPGDYDAEIERGPEYTSVSRRIRVGSEAGRETTVELQRLANLAAAGWWSGDLHVHRPLADIELLMKAEDLNVAPVITWWNDKDLWNGKEIPGEQVVRFDGHRFYSKMGGEDEREGGAVLYYGLAKPLAIRGASREYPSPIQSLLEAKKETGVHVDIEKPFWWDVPVWVASGQVDTIGLANNHLCRSVMSETEAWGRPRDAARLPPPLGNAYWSQEIYYQILNAGLRIPPSAGSASGVLPNPVGYNRVYVHLDGEPTYEKWFAGLRAGRSFVTNGPLLRVRANGEDPGHVFKSEKTLSIDLSATLEGRERVSVLEIIRDGRVERRVPVQDPLGKIEFSSSGWFLVRSIADNAQTFRFASTAPFYVEIGGTTSRISKASTRFFLDWIDERMARVPLKLKEPQELEEVLRWHRQAKEWWTRLASQANAE